MEQIIRYLKYSFKNHPAFFIKVLLYSLLITLFNVIPLYVLQGFLNRMQDISPAGIVVFAVLIALLLIVNSWMNAKYSAVLDEYGGILISRLMTDAQESMDKTPMNQIDELDTSRIKHILFGDCMDIFRVIGHHLPMLLSSLLFVLFGLIIASSYSLKNTMITAVSFLLGILISIYSRKKIDKVASGTNAAIKELHSQLNDYVDDIESSKINGWLSYHQKQTRDNVDNFINKAKQEDMTINFYSSLISNYNLAVNILFSALLALPASDSSNKQFAFFMVLLSIVLSQGQEVESLIQNISKSLVSFRNYDSLVNRTYPQKNQHIEEIETIDVKDVSFNYHQKESIINDLSLSLKKGDCALLEGLNGSGKSTFLKLICGLYDPSKGEILVNGLLLRNVCTEDLIRQIVYLGQEEPILNLSVRDYLKQIKDDITDEEISEMSSVLNLPDPDTMITHNGDNLSGGQKKKMIIAKMLLKEKDASLIILDEIEAGLDKETLNWFIDHVNQMIQNKDKIVMIITHSNAKDYLVSRKIHF